MSGRATTPAGPLGRLEAGGLALLVERGGELVFASDRTGLRPLFRGVLEHPDLLEGSTIACQQVGLAAAYLLLHARVAKVATFAASREGERVLSEAGVACEARQKVKAFEDEPVFPDGTGLEALAAEAGSPGRFWEALRARLG